MSVNPSAFPWAIPDHCGGAHTGMSLRDYFAGQALAGIAAAFVRVSRRDGETMAQAEARWCYERADAMLAEREKGFS